MAYRNKAKLIKFSPEEWEKVCKRAAALNQRTGTYIRKIAVNGIIKSYSIRNFDNLKRMLNRIGNELNQIAKVANSTQSIYEKDVEDLRRSYNDMRIILDYYLAPLKSTNLFEEDQHGDHKAHCRT